MTSDDILRELTNVAKTLEWARSRTVGGVLAALASESSIAAWLKGYWSATLLSQPAASIGARLRMDCEACETGVIDLCELMTRRLEKLGGPLRTLAEPPTKVQPKRRVEWSPYDYGRGPVRA